jgi:hypothetical protein
MHEAFITQPEKIPVKSHIIFLFSDDKTTFNFQWKVTVVSSEQKAKHCLPLGQVFNGEKPSPHYLLGYRIGAMIVSPEVRENFETYV